tara:strand:+ start:840 stop:1013 length:174 start_codon:yes stop_codon:yes gene_type:complete
MNITSAQYTRNIENTKNENIKATIDGQEMFVPISTNNRHYQAIQEWVAEGNTIAEAD